MSTDDHSMYKSVLPPRGLGVTVTQTLALTFVRALMPVRVIGAENLEQWNGPAVVIANHQSHLDIPSVLCAIGTQHRRRLAVAAAADYFFTNKLKGRTVATLFGAVPLPRQGGSREALDGLKDRLRGGWSVFLFPEGTRRIDEVVDSTEPLGFKKGFAFLAVDTQVPVLPIYIHGVHDLMPKGALLPLPGGVLLNIGKPLTPGNDYENLITRAEQAIRTLREDVEERLQGWGTHAEIESVSEERP